MKTDFYAQVGKYYDDEANEFDDRYWKNPVLQQIRQAFREEVKRHAYSNMLEIGCGTGLDLTHFASIHPSIEIHGIDISPNMTDVAKWKIQKSKLKFVDAHHAGVEDLPTLFPDKKFDLIYVFFGALNTVENFKINADILCNMLSKDGTMILSFVNKWYVGGMIIEALRFRIGRALARIKPQWGGYSPTKYLPSQCYSPRMVKKAFSSMILENRAGFSIIHPAWYFTRINQKIGRMTRLLWKVDQKMNKTFMWRFGEYTLFTFKHK